MQKLVYLSNSRDYTEQGDINENKYFTRINKLLDEGWTIAHVLPNGMPFEFEPEQKNEHKESVVALVLLEKLDEQK